MQSSVEKRQQLQWNISFRSEFSIESPNIVYREIEYLHD
jgi:hypothetical protein